MFNIADLSQVHHMQVQVQVSLIKTVFFIYIFGNIRDKVTILYDKKLPVLLSIDLGMTILREIVVSFSACLSSVCRGFWSHTKANEDTALLSATKM